MRRRFTVGVITLAVAGAGLYSAGLPASSTDVINTLEPSADEQTSVVEVHVADRDELDKLVATGVDLDHQVHELEDGIEVHAVVTPSEVEALEAMGFETGDVVLSPADTEAALAERDATIAAHVAENEQFAASAYDETNPDVSDVKIVRADYYTTQTGAQVLSVEAKWAQGQTSSQQLVVERDSGPGTEMGSGGTQNISRFVDAGVYLYHRGASSVSTRPEYVRITSPTGDVAVAKVNDWLPIEGDDEFKGDVYEEDFITSYLTPTELYDRILQLAAEFPDLAEIVELPYQTNGYRRNAQALLDRPSRLEVDPPSAAAGAYGFAGPAGYGPGLPEDGLAGSFAVVNDGVDNPTDGCEPLAGFPAGSIALVDRGACNFTLKTQNAQAAGATAVVIVNNVPGSPFSPGGSASGITIPTVMISQDDGTLIKNSLPATGTLIPPAPIASRVGVDSLAWGHEGGNDLTIAAVNPGVADSPLSVDVNGNDITVNLGTNSSGALSSTAAEVADAINNDPAASGLVFAYTYRGSTGNGVVPVTPRQNLSDFLSAPDTVSRDPHPVYAIRIGKHRDGSKMGVLAYAQEHAREWVPPLVTIETAERLLRNYAHHGPTKQLLNNLDIWIAPSINPDGGHYSFYDDNGQRRSMTRHCEVTGAYDLNARDDWGVDNNRNYTEYSLFDGYSGASTSCTSDVFAGPSELSEPENKNLDWLASRPNIKFSMNLHSSGNYFMWSPGSYATPGRISAPRPTLAEESFFWGASSQILTAIKRHRGLSVTPARTGPISDVLYSAAGNSGDMLWYKYGIYAWNFEVGTSFQPNWTEAHNETMEFSNGLVELFRVARSFDTDYTRPESSIVVSESSTPGMVNMKFEASEPAAVFYTLDGSVPTLSSTLYASAGIREAGELLTVPAGTTVHWFSVDAAGNVEQNYQPDGKAKNFRKGIATLGE
ncbi:MAG TPA: M14 family zinc carboxypeptidase [Jiangellaceae bacterium]